MNTVNLKPNSVVPKSGIYYCTMCEHGDSAVRNAVEKYAKQDGIDPKILDGMFEGMGIGTNETTTRARFNAGDRFTECPRHKNATGWTFEKEEETTTVVAPVTTQRPEEILMMECPPFPGQALCSDNQCPCANTTMPPAQGYLWIKPEVVSIPLQIGHHFRLKSATDSD